MAETDQETGLLNGTVSHSDVASMIDATHVQVDQDGMSEELLRQALAEANAFASVSYAVSGNDSEVCDTGQDNAEVNGDLTSVNSVENGSETQLSTNSEAVLVHNSSNLLNGSSESIFTNGTSNVLGIESNGHFTVDIGLESLPEGHIISIPNDIMSGSVIIPGTQNDKLQQSVEPQIIENEEGQLLQDDSTTMESEYIQGNTNEQLSQSETFTHPNTITVSAPSGIQMSQEVLQNVIQQVQAQQALAAQKKHLTDTSNSQQETISFTLVSPSQPNNASPPLGSSQNPIRIIQQGNRYTPMQQLTAEQLQQIMQVVQQQHVSKNSQDNGGSVIFNPQTNTRIMYRVIYPSELHKSQNATTYHVIRPSTATQEQQTANSQHKRPYRKRKDVSNNSAGIEDEEKDKSVSDTPELSKEEKEERKKHRPRTRSGRVSKPPKHMVQDYKHIHVLDWDEDYDDSDGGYSDFKHSDEEDKIKQEVDDESLASPDLSSNRGGRPRNHRCQTCDKSYIGQAGLNRHYRLNPDHCTNPSENGSISSLHNGSLDGEDSKDASLLQDGSSSHMSDTTAEVSKINDGMDNFSEDSNTQDSLNSIGATSPVVKRGRGRGGYRGRWAHWKQNAQLRRKSKLKELIKQCKDEELMEVVLPRLVNSVSVWEFLMMKSEKGGSRPQVDVIYREFESLRQHVQRACADYMKPLSQEELVDDNLQCKMIKVSDKNLATCLGLDTLTYRVREMPPGDSNSFSSLHNKLSAAALTVVSNTKPTLDQPDAKRSGSEVPLEQGQNQAKKPKISTYVSWDRLSQPANVNASVVTSQQGSSLEEKTIISRSDSSLSSVSSLSSSSVTSPQLNFSTAVTSSTVTTSSSPPTFTSSVSKPVSVSSVTVRSPFVHIACPTTKPTTVSYVLADTKGQHLLGANKGASKGQSVPVLITPQLTTGQILPTISSVQPKILVATPQSQQASAPATIASQQPNATTLLLATAAPPSVQHRVVVRQPPKQTKILVPSQSTAGKPQGMSTISLFSTTASPSVSHSRSILSQAKPAEVKVSRQLFHDTTSSTISTSVALSNGRSSNKTASLLSTSQTVFQPHLPARTSTVPVISPIVSSNTTEVNKPKLMLSTRTLVTPPSGQQFIASPNKASGVQVIVSESEMDDIEVLNSLGFTDDLSTLAVSADNLSGTLSTTDLVSVSSVTEADSFLHPQATDSNCKYVTTGEASVTSSPSFSMIQNGTISVLDGMAYINGSSTDFSTNSSPPISIKDSSNGSAGTLVVSSATSTGDFIISKAQMGFSSTVLHSSPYTNGGSQDIKTESLNNSSMILADMSGLQYEQADASVHLNGRSLLQSVETPEDSISLLSDNLPVSEPPDADVHFLDTRDSGMPSGDEVDNQIYLSEGTNIYQTEDGTIIIQSADGNTYQLQGPQGLSLETVQALLSGQLNQLTEDAGSGGIQML